MDLQLMAPSDQPLRAVFALIDQEPSDGEVLGMNAALARLCRAAVRALPASGVGLSVMTSDNVRGLSVASSTSSEEVEELQFTLGEGPCREAYAAGKPVLAADLSKEMARWPAYSSAARSHGVEAVFAFPFGMGGASVGVMDVYRDEPGSLASSAFSQAVTFADAAIRTIIDNWERSDDDDETLYFDGDVANRLELYQAQGMLTVQLGVGLDEAMARLRAHAFANDRRLGQVAHDIVTRRLTLDPDGR